MDQLIPEEIAHFLRERRSPKSDEEIDLFMETIVRHYHKPDRGAGLVGVGGSDAVTHYKDIKRVILEMDKVSKFTSRSAFVDFGSGPGFFPIYVALKHRIPCYGIESQPQSVELGRIYLKWAFLENLDLDPRTPDQWKEQDMKWNREHGPLVLFHASYFEVLRKDWIPHRSITHLVTYDAVYIPDAMNAIRRLVKPYAVTGATSKKNASFLPRTAIEQARIPSVRVGHSSFTFVIWKNEPGGDQGSSSEEENDTEPDKKTQKTSWLVWYISHDEALLATAEERFGAEWRAQVGTLLANHGLDIDKTILWLEGYRTTRRKGPDRHTMLPVINKS
jgi:hypothetical protein